MNWLFKEEPTNYSYDALAKDGKTTWTGVRNPLAQKHLRSVAKGDRIFFYHTGSEKAVVGVMKAAGPGVPRSGGHERQALRRRRRAGEEAGAARDAGRDQSRQSVRHVCARSPLAVVGDAGDRTGVGAYRKDVGGVTPIATA